MDECVKCRQILPKDSVNNKFYSGAAKFASLNYGVDAAILWGNIYKFPTKILDYNAELFKQSGMTYHPGLLEGDMNFNQIQECRWRGLTH